MFKVILFAVTLVLMVTTFKFAYLASTSHRAPSASVVASMGSGRPPPNEPQQTLVASTPSSAASTQEPGSSRNRTIPNSVTSAPSGPNGNQVTTARGVSATSDKPLPQPPPTTSSQTVDPNLDPDEVTISSGDVPPANATSGSVTLPPTLETPDKTILNPNKPQLTPDGGGASAGAPAAGRPSSSSQLSVLFYSLFIVYVSFVKLAYHNIHFIKRNLTEQGILMIFGILWQLAARQISSEHDSFPRFNSRIFFYLFLPSTVLESASTLSNKWLFFNLLPILTHSIVGTVLYASSMGFTIFALSRSEVFTSNWMDQLRQRSAGIGAGAAGWAAAHRMPASLVAPDAGNLVAFQLPAGHTRPAPAEDGGGLPTLAALGQTMDDLVLQNDFSNLTLADCLMVGTILSSIDSAPMLNVFKQYQVNEKLYYLVLGENLMNQAVVITLFGLLLEFFETTRLTVIKIYVAILQFFANLIGAVLIGFVLALFALVAVRLIKRFHVPHALSSYHNQCQAMVETLLILKLAYLTYTLSSLAGTSSILGLATFGILNDQYIKHNLNLRSQLAFRQVILGMRTLGYSLVYPLLGMLLVDTALSSQSAAAILLQHAASSATTTLASGAPSKQKPLGSGGPAASSTGATTNSTTATTTTTTPTTTATTTAATTTAPPTGAQGAGLHWNFKFLAIVILLTVAYRFLIVIALGLAGNVLTCGQLKIKFKEQLLMAYGGFKGPLSIALVHSLMEHQEHRERIVRNKHLFKYTVLINIFISAVLAGTFIRPLVARIQSTLIGRASTNLGDSTSSTIVFEHINHKLTEYVSHGLNSILGRTRSPYDKFIEFNETQIKPWLVRNDSNTNWLSVFYDNLILDETLNANCFYVVTEDPTTMRVLKLKLEDENSRLTSWLKRRTSSVSFLDTIGEASQGPDRLAPHRPPQPAAIGAATMGRLRSSRNVSLVSKRVVAPSAEPRAGPPSPASRRRAPEPRDREVLREFVMFNLKLENARRRRAHRKVSTVSPARRQQQQQQQQHQQGRPVATERFMIEDSSASSRAPNDSSLDRASRQVHLNRMEANLGAVNEPPASGDGGGPNRPLPVPEPPAQSRLGRRPGPSLLDATFDRGSPSPERPGHSKASAASIRRETPTASRREEVRVAKSRRRRHN